MNDIEQWEYKHLIQKPDSESETIRTVIHEGPSDYQLDILSDNPWLYEFLAYFSVWALEKGYWKMWCQSCLSFHTEEECPYEDEDDKWK